MEAAAVFRSFLMVFGDELHVFRADHVRFSAHCVGAPETVINAS